MVHLGSTANQLPAGARRASRGGVGVDRRAAGRIIGSSMTDETNLFGSGCHGSSFHFTPEFPVFERNFQRFWRQIFKIVKIRFRWIRISVDFFSKLCEPYGAENTRNDFIDDRSCPCGCHGDRWRLIFPLFVRVFCLFISVGKRQQLLALVPHPHLTWNTRGLGHPDYVEHVPLLLARRQKSIRNSN